MAGRQCRKKLWQTVYDPEPAQEPLPGTIKGMGIEVGIKARLLWPGGILVEDIRHHDYDEAVRRTKALIGDPTVPAIFEATLVHDGVLVRVDVLERLPNGRWRLNEVKSSKDEHLEDLALQTYVIAGNGLELADAYLVFVNGRFGFKLDLKPILNRVWRLLPDKLRDRLRWQYLRGVWWLWSIFGLSGGVALALWPFPLLVGPPRGSNRRQRQ